MNQRYRKNVPVYVALFSIVLIVLVLALGSGIGNSTETPINPRPFLTLTFIWNTPSTLLRTKTKTPIAPPLIPSTPDPPTKTVTPIAPPTIQIIVLGPKTILTPYKPIPDCASSRIYVGDVVTLEDGIDHLSLRSTPDTHPSDNIIGKLYKGDSANVIDGPVCNYDWILWKIKLVSDGLIGWIPESDGREFWLMPTK